MIAAHRGFRSIRPENTLCAFEASLGHCHYIELDVQVSSDGVPVIHHDDMTGRTCTLPHSGLEHKRIDSLSCDELKDLDFGSWFLLADPFKTLQNGVVTKQDIAGLMPQKILTLRELLAWRNSTGIPLNIEIKDQQGEKFDGQIVDLVLQEIKRAGCEDQLLISSFNHDYLRQIKKRYPALALGALQEGENPDGLLAYLHELGVSAYHPDQDLVDGVLIRQLRNQGIDVNIYTVNDVEQQKSFLRLGATSVITDFPALSLLDQLG